LRAFVVLSRDPAGVEGAYSALARLWEEYSIEEVFLVAPKSLAQDVIESLKWWASRLTESVDVVRVETAPESMGSRGLVEELAEVFARECDSRDSVILVSSAGRLAAAAAAVAGVRVSKECRVDVAHVHFYFGPWRGLVYPYTPLRLEPLVVLHPGVERVPRAETSASRAPEPQPGSSGYCESRIMGRLPPLRCAVAELARRINALLTPGFGLPDGGGGCGKLIVKIGGSPLGGADLCREKEVANLVSRLASRVLSLEDAGMGRPIRSALAWSGAAHLKARFEDGREVPLPELVFKNTVVIDTVLVYYGAHRYAWEGGNILVPECVIREVHGRLANSVKQGRAARGDAVADVLAYLALEDLLGANTPVAPTPAGQCDTAIPKMDPIILDGKVLATADDGAYRYWVTHPSRKLATPVKVYFDPDEAIRQEVDAARNPVMLSRLYYSLYQLLLFYALLDTQGVSGATPLELTISSDRGEEQVKPPVGVLLKAVGLTRYAGKRGQGR